MYVTCGWVCGPHRMLARRDTRCCCALTLRFLQAEGAAADTAVALTVLVATTVAGFDLGLAGSGFGVFTTRRVLPDAGFCAGSGTAALVVVPARAAVAPAAVPCATVLVAKLG